MSLVFETGSAPVPADPNRADVACFIGYVAARRGTGVARVVEDWDSFDQHYAWDARPLDETGTGTCATALGAAVRSFFAHGGRCAWIVPVGAPAPLLESAASRTAQRGARLTRLIPGSDPDTPQPPFSPWEPATWQGIQHLYGLDECSLVLLPDLADLCAEAAPQPQVAIVPPAPPEGFVECSSDDLPAEDTSLRRIPAPRLGVAGYAAWKQALDAARDFLHRWQREAILLASLPLPHLDAQVRVAGQILPAQTDMAAWLREIGILTGPGEADRPAEALVQLAWPWLRTREAGDLPEGLEAPEGVLAGLIAGSAVERGCHRSVAGDYSLARLRGLAGGEPVPAWSHAETSPEARLARRICLFAPQAGGWALQSDVTTTAKGSCRFGGASRLLGNLLRTCRRAGEGVVFEHNGEATWASLRRAVESVLLHYWHEGAFSGSNANEAFSVRCDRTTMTQNDLDAGRLIVEIQVWPALSIERIRVVLSLGEAAGVSSLREAA